MFNFCMKRAKFNLNRKHYNIFYIEVRMLAAVKFSNVDSFYDYF